MCMPGMSTTQASASREAGEQYWDWMLLCEHRDCRLQAIMLDMSPLHRECRVEEGELYAIEGKSTRGRRKRARIRV